jgi:hypothetical protein
MTLRLGAPDRRRGNRGAPFGEPTRQQLTDTILGCYNDLPGLSLHLPQAARLFGLRLRTCESVLNDLVRAGRLHRAHDGQYTAPLHEPDGRGAATYRGGTGMPGEPRAWSERTARTDLENG